MLAIIYLTISFIFGFLVSQRISIVDKKENLIWSHLAMSIGIGYITIGWTSYIFAYIAKCCFNADRPKMIGSVLSMSILAVLSFIVAVTTKEDKIHYISDKKTFIKESVFFVLLFLFILYTMSYVFYTEDNILYSGVSVFSDYAPHTAVIRSFSMHDNFPTQYPHYGGEDIKYHFMFQFLVGNLEYLGMRIDYAFNVTSAAALWGFLVLLYFFAKKISGKSIAGVITIIMFFCRSSFAVFSKLAEFAGCVFTDGFKDAWHQFICNTDFIGTTTHEDWGLWNYNVFLNQRHLAVGLLISIIVIMYFVDENDYEYKVTQALAVKSWKSKNIFATVFFGVLLGAVTFWNGAAVIATLLILCGMAVMSSRKLDYIIVAALSISLSCIQKIFFIDSTTGQDISVSFHPGFLADNASFSSITSYMLKLSGIFFVGALLFIFAFKGIKRILSVSFLLPTAFAFTISMTPDITVNHKYIIISTIFINILWTYVITNMFYSKRVKTMSITAAIALLFILTATGMYDMITIYNKDKETVAVNMDSEITQWLINNTDEDDLILTGEDSMSDITISGAMLYNGWPYYAWSAGYDTDTRAKNAIRIYTTDDKDEIKNIVESEEIDYIIYQRGMTYEGNVCRDDVISKIYKKVFECDGYIIYRTI